MSRHPRRRAVLALIAGLLVLRAAAPAAHATGGGGGGEPEPPLPPSDVTIKGNITLVRCTTAAANVQVKAHGTTYPYEDKTVLATLSNGALKYSIGSLPRGTYTMTAKTINNKCLYGI